LPRNPAQSRTFTRFSEHLSADKRCLGDNPQPNLAPISAALPVSLPSTIRRNTPDLSRHDRNLARFQDQKGK
jgi:hypothetical protein